MERATPTIGLLAMQGAYRDHAAALDDVGMTSREVRTPDQLAAVDAIVVPGGESTAIRMALARCGLYEPLRDRIATGMPVLATCAGLVVLATSPEDGAPPTFGLLDVEVERNGFGRQPFSFEVPVELDDRHHVPGVFIRAPRITAFGETIEVIGRIAGGTNSGEPVAVRRGSIIACTFHPELTADRTIHRRFALTVVQASSATTR